MERVYNSSMSKNRTNQRVYEEGTTHSWAGAEGETCTAAVQSLMLRERLHTPRCSYAALARSRCSRFFPALDSGTARIRAPTVGPYLPPPAAQEGPLERKRGLEPQVYLHYEVSERRTTRRFRKLSYLLAAEERPALKVRRSPSMTRQNGQ
jgi:hypothetical protein